MHRAATRVNWTRGAFAAVCTLISLFVIPALAQAPDSAPPTEPATTEGDDTSKTLLGDVGGLRSAIKPYGLTLSATETSEILGNVSGGIRRGAIYEGLTDANLQWDLRPYFHWRGVLYARALQIHGRGLSLNDLGNNLNTVSSIEATRTTKLFELWYEQHIGDWLRIRIGQQAADQEFIISTTAKVFVNGAFGFPTLPATVLPAGGPDYPLSTPAVRFRVDANEALTFYAGLFNGNPTGAGFNAANPQAGDLSGTAFRVNDGVLALFETRYNPENSPQNGTYRAGAWFNSERFPSQHFDTAGRSLASPLSTGTPRLLDNNYSIYGIVDQPLTVDKDGKGLSAFLRMMGAPGDRNLIDFYFDAGLAYKGPFGRGDDRVGVGFAYARIGSAARALDADTVALGGTANPIRTREMVLEATYQYTVDGWKWLQLQPDFQYVVNPGGGIANPNAPGRRIGNAAVLGLRTVITF